MFVYFRSIISDYCQYSKSKTKNLACIYFIVGGVLGCWKDHLYKTNKKDELEEGADEVRKKLINQKQLKKEKEI